MKIKKALKNIKNIHSVDFKKSPLVWGAEPRIRFLAKTGSSSLLNIYEIKTVSQSLIYSNIIDRKKEEKDIDPNTKLLKKSPISTSKKNRDQDPKHWNNSEHIWQVSWRDSYPSTKCNIFTWNPGKLPQIIVGIRFVPELYAHFWRTNNSLW